MEIQTSMLMNHFDTQIQTCTNSGPRVSCLFSTVGSKFLYKCQILLLVILLIITVCFNIFFLQIICCCCLLMFIWILPPCLVNVFFSFQKTNRPESLLDIHQKELKIKKVWKPLMALVTFLKFYEQIHLYNFLTDKFC
jgi:hypothetical protein